MTTHDAVNFGAGGGVPIGTILALMGTTPPAGYLICDGSVYDVTLYPFLADYFEEQFGTKNYFGGDGENTFAVPDLRGEFLRGTGTATRASGNGAAVGVHQAPTEIPNVWAYQQTTIAAESNAGASNEASNVDLSFVKTRRAINGSKASNGNEGSRMYRYTTRPTNTSVLYCIKC